MYKLQRLVEEGRVVGLSLGVPEVDAYLRFLGHRCRPNTWLNYGFDLQVFLNAVQKPVLEVTPADILAFIQQQWETPRRQQRRESGTGPGLSSRTVKRRLTAISGFYEYVRICGETSLTANPVPRGLTARDVFWGNRFKSGSPLPLIRTPRTLPRPLDAEEITGFLNSLRTLRDKAIVLLMLFAGLRKSEVLDLTLKDIDFGQRTVLIRDGKGGHERMAAVSQTALEALLRYLNEERPQSSSPYLFLVLKGRHRGQHMSIPALDMIVWYHRKQAGTPGVQCHRFRHTCLTRLRQGGMSLEALQAQAGHRSPSSTRIYLHLCPRELRQEYLKVSQILLASTAEARND